MVYLRRMARWTGLATAAALLAAVAVADVGSAEDAEEKGAATTQPPIATGSATASAAGPERAGGIAETFDVASANRRAYARITQALAKPAEFGFDSASLEDVATRFEIELGVPVQIDRRALADAGIDPASADFSFRKAPISSRSALDVILEGQNLDWVVKHEMLWITSSDAAEGILETRIHDISERDEFGEFIHEDIEAIIELITSKVAPVTWDAVGGSGSIREYHASDLYVLVISQTRPAHEQIERLLADLQAARRPATEGTSVGVAQPKRRPTASDEDTPKSSSLAADTNRDAVVRGANDMAFDLYRQFVAGNDKNCFFSPHSIATALAMVKAGATGQTGDEIAAVLHFSGADGDLHAGYGSLRAALRGGADERGYEIRAANRLWAKPNLKLETPFVDTLRGRYGGELGAVDFAANPDAARQAINAWVADQTGDRIRDLMQPHTINRETRAVLANAVYFNGKWTENFDPYDTKPLPFDAVDGRRRVETMSQQVALPYAEVDGVQAVALTYGSPELDERAAMLVLLPRVGDGTLGTLEKSLSAEYVEKIVGQLKSQEVKVYLPKFTFSDSFDLRENLAQLGIQRAFDVENAEFDGITTTERLYVEHVVHQAFIRVDEKGTEAAAATGGSFGFGGVTAPPKRVVFRADHPFVFLIYDARTRSILFLGRVTSPPEEEAS